MRVIEAVAARLDQSVNMAGNLEVDLPTMVSHRVV
jgi:hypothetical protein